MNLTHPFLDLHGDKLREECGIFGAINAADASAATALGLHALQHRGQEAVGITSFDGSEFFSRRALGHVAENCPALWPQGTFAILPRAVLAYAMCSHYSRTLQAVDLQSPTMAISQTRALFDQNWLVAARSSSQRRIQKS